VHDDETLNPAAGDDDIEMAPDYVGRASADQGGSTPWSDDEQEGMRTFREVESQDHPFLDQAYLDENYIEMPPDPASTAAAWEDFDKAAERYNAYSEAESTWFKAYEPVATELIAAREAADKAAAENAPDAAELKAKVDALEVVVSGPRAAMNALEAKKAEAETEMDDAHTKALDTEDTYRAARDLAAIEEEAAAIEEEGAAIEEEGSFFDYD
jgi:hypothetical protein